MLRTRWLMIGLRLEVRNGFTDSASASTNSAGWVDGHTSHFTLHTELHTHTSHRFAEGVRCLSWKIPIHYTLYTMHCTVHYYALSIVVQLPWLAIVGVQPLSLQPRACIVLWYLLFGPQFFACWSWRPRPRIRRTWTRTWNDKKRRLAISSAVAWPSEAQSKSRIADGWRDRRDLTSQAKRLNWTSINLSKTIYQYCMYYILYTIYPHLNKHDLDLTPAFLVWSVLAVQVRSVQ